MWNYAAICKRTGCRRFVKKVEIWTQAPGLSTTRVIVVSWLIAFFEYIFQVPANRVGSQIFTVTQLKILQECITLVVFTGIAFLLFGETMKWNNLVSYVLIVGAVYFSFAY